MRVHWGQVKSPLLMLLAVGAAILSMATGDVGDILVILCASVSLGFWNECKAQRTADSLQDRITHSTVVVRDGVQKEIEVSHVVRGDIVRISLGHVVPADLRLFQTTNLSCDESAITGESQAPPRTPRRSGAPGFYVAVRMTVDRAPTVYRVWPESSGRGGSDRSSGEGRAVSTSRCQSWSAGRAGSAKSSGSQ